MNWNRIIGFLMMSNILACSQDKMPVIKQLLNQNWQFQQEGSEEWRSAEVPGVVHTDLMRHKLIPDPWIGLNEQKVQWIENENWIYRSDFEVSSEMLGRERIELVFEGLDTYAEVKLNDVSILTANNMFRTWRVDVKALLKEGINTISIRFLSALTVNEEKLRSLNYQLPASNENVELKVSPFTRKAPYHFGWDWGPRLVTSAIWKDVYLESWDEVRIEHIRIVQNEVNDSLARLKAIVNISSVNTQSLSIQIIDNEYYIDLIRGENKIEIDFEIADPQLWWPNGWGEAFLHKIPISLKDKSDILDSDTLSIGLRTVELIREKDNIGESFYFKVNGHPIFAKGVNYIPQSHFLPSVKPEDYRRLLQQVKNSGMNMIRVWGGGIYENDLFYELCDQYGIMVWQDFIFANTMYPGDSAFIMNVKNEIADNVIRLRNHPSIVHWNGNNEIEVAWNNWGWQKQYAYSDADSTEIWDDYKMLFQDSIPHWLSLWDNRSYTSTSPLSNWGKAENFNSGSMHYWGVWHGNDQFEDYKSNVGRFMSEYGFQSFPDIETIGFYADSSNWDVNSEVMKHHQKSYVGNGLIEQQIEKYYGGSKNFKDFVIKSQKTQAKAMQMAIDAHRLAKGHCWGTLFWQLNDCWPGPSWSAIDVFGREKSFYKDLKILYAPVALIPEFGNDRIQITLINDQLKDFQGNARLIFHNADTFEFPVSCDANGIKKVYNEALRKYTQHIKLQIIVDEKCNFERVIDLSI